MEKMLPKKNSSEMLKRAQTFLTKKPEKTYFTHSEIRELVHELVSCQIEVELQNEDLRTSQDALEKSSIQYANLKDHDAPTAYITISDNGLILEANRMASSMLGFTRGELLNRPCTDFIVPADQDTFSMHEKNLLKTRQPQSFELLLQRKDRSIFHAHVEIVIHTGAPDSPRQLRAIVRDISVKKKEELAKLRHLKNKYWDIVMDQTDLVCRFDPAGRITFVNDSYCRYFSTNYKDILGTQFLPQIHKDDQDVVRNHFTTLTPPEPETTLEHRVHMQDGRIHWLQWDGRALYDHEGKVTEYQIVGRDVTNLKEIEKNLLSELRLRQVFLDALPCIALLLKYDSREIIAANKAAMEVGAVPGLKCYAAWLDRENPCPWCPAAETRLKGEPYNLQFWAKDIFWDAHWVPVDEDTYLLYIFDNNKKYKIKETLRKTYRELEHRVAERTLELQQSNKQLLHAEKLTAVGNLSASIAHEFNNPLQSVITIINGIIKYSSLEEEERDLVNVALRECQRMKNLVANLSDFFQPTNGKVEQVDIHMVLDALFLLTQKDFQSRQIEIVKKYGDHIFPVLAVIDQLKQVFLNLLNNAADACIGRGIITVATEKIDDKNIAIHVEDNGIGIKSTDINHIFDPFYTTKSGLKGTGLGLSVSEGIIKKHGGRIEVQSKSGEGSTFSVFLPYQGGTL